ncbi:MAG: type II toxin-antitoxin system RelE/ParE family toxin [Betaproteobacteria bacterium]
MKQVVRAQTYQDCLNAIEARIALDNPSAGVAMWFHIDDQVQSLVNENFPRRPGRVSGTFELVAHPNVVILEEDASTVTVLNVVHARQKWP